jgi:hypothetical protein
LALAVSAGCAKAQAGPAPSMPTLAPPDVPPRVIAEYEPDPPLPSEPVSAEAVTPALRPARPPRREPARPAETASEDPPAPAPAAVPIVPPPALALQMPAASAKADQSIRTLLARAARDLLRVDYRQLDADRRAQYDTAKGFMQQAEDALKARNVMYAGKLADKAATLATALLP